MDKKTLIDLFERRDKKRRRILYELYFDLITSKLTASYIAEMICNDLGQAEMVCAADIKFCRFHFKNKTIRPVTAKPIVQSPVSAVTVKLRTETPEDGFASFCSDPETMSTQENIIVQSKFSKK